MMNGLVIRPERKEELKEIHDLIQEAFLTAKVRGGDEQDFAERLRNSSYYIPSLALVAEWKGKIIGHIMFTYTHITMTSCARLRVLMAAPLSVRQQYRGRGIGGALLCEGLRLAAEEGHRAVFLCGDPNYYQRFGFRSIDEFSIYHATIPTPYVMGLELREGALRNVKGLLRLE